MRPTKKQLAAAAIGTLIALPCLAQADTTRQQHPVLSALTNMTHAVTDWATAPVQKRTSVTEHVNGSDFRDNRDSTIMRNDVPMNQTTLKTEPAREGSWSTSSSSPTSDAHM